MDLLSLDQAIRLPLRVEEALGCPRCHVRLAGSLRCDRCDFQMAWNDGVLVCRPEEAAMAKRSADAPLLEEPSLSRFLPATARLILDYSAGAFAAAEWMRERPRTDVVRLHRDSVDVQRELRRRGSPGVLLVSPLGEIPFADRTVDAVLAPYLRPGDAEWEVSAFRREAMRVLRPGGWLIVRCERTRRVRSLARIRRRLEYEGYRYLGGEAEFAWGGGRLTRMLPERFAEWLPARWFTVVAARG